MAATLKRLVSSTIAASAAALYTATDANARIQAMTLTNTDGSARTVSIWLTSGGGAGNTNIILKDKSIAAGGSYTAREAINQVIPDGASIFASASVANVVTMVASGVEIAT